MTNQVLFIQGGGEGGYTADILMVDSLRKSLGEEYNIDYPVLESDETKSDFGWVRQIKEKIAGFKSGVILVGHSLGASMLLKVLSESKLHDGIKGAFLISTPFWRGNEDWKVGLKLRDDFADSLPHNIPIFFYHCRDDEEVPFEHFSVYRGKISHATFREIEKGGHLLNNDLEVVAKDIEGIL